jgi:hypothetical protein
MTLSPEHEHEVSLLRRLVEAFTEELDLPLKSGRCRTYVIHLSPSSHGTVNRCFSRGAVHSIRAL